MSKTILILNYYWPPSGGPAVQRWVALTRHLSPLGIKCLVVTIDDKLATYPMRDESQLKEIPTGVEVYRTGTSELFWIYKKYIGKGKVPASGMVDDPNPGLLKKIARFVRGNFFIPDPRRGWNCHAFKKAEELLETPSIDLVITAGPPQSTHLIGLQLKKKYNIRWIADFHDYWTDIFYISHFYRTPLAHQLDRWYERQVLKQANAILSHCQTAIQLLGARIQNPAKIHLLPMGYEESLFPTPPDFQNQDSFTLTYTGTLADHYEPQALFLALAKLVKEYPDQPIKFRFVGILASSLKEEIKQLGLEPIMEYTGYVSHPMAIQYLYQATLLFILSPRSTHEGNALPGKIFEYLAVQKPIVSLGPEDSETAHFLTKHQAGKNFRRSEVEQVYTYLKELFQQWQLHKTLDLTASDEAYKSYGRAAGAKRLAQLFDEIIAASPSE